MVLFFFKDMAGLVSGFMTNVFCAINSPHGKTIFTENVESFEKLKKALF
jgi:hypothetical protein